MKLVELDAVIAALEADRLAYLSEAYAVDQPMSSFAERFAVGQCIKTILRLPVIEVDD